MDPSKRNAQALSNRVDDICDSLSSHFTAVVTAGAVTAQQDENDLSAVAQNEMAIEEQSAALVRAAQDMSTLIRDLQELWLFGSLDTLTNPSDEQAHKDKALAVAAKIENLAKDQGQGKGQSQAQSQSGER